MLLDYIRRNHADNISLPRIERHEMQILSEDTLPKFIKAFDEHKFYTALFTGLREGEVTGLTWHCVDFEAGTLHIRQQLQRERKQGSQYKFMSLKNDKPRTITPAPAVMQRLKAEQKKQRDNRRELGTAWSNPMNLVFTNELGGYLRNETVYKMFKQIAVRLGEPKLRMHDLRHSYAVHALRSGDDIKEQCRIR